MTYDLKSCPTPVYSVAIDWKKRIYKTFDEFDDAVIFAREMMEADGDKIFVGEKGAGSGILMWKDANGSKKVYTKNIGTINSHEIIKWEMQKRKEIREKEEREKWDRIRAMYGKGPFANQA